MLTNTLGRAECGNFDIAANKEWLVTNGLGGYAAGTISGTNTRRYHGLLVAALQPPVGRTVLVAKVDGTATYADKTYPLFANEFADGTIDPHGYRYLESFHLEGLIPVWTYALADARLEQRVWMKHGHNTTYLTFTLTRATAALSLTLTPLCTYRDYHSHHRGSWSFEAKAIPHGFEICNSHGAQAYRVVADRGKFQLAPEWYWAFKHRLESYRGLDDIEDLLAAGRFTATLRPGQTLTLICSTEPVEPHDGITALKQEQQRQAGLLKQLPADQPDWIQQLSLAADQFIVQRRAESGEAGQTVIAGYPWFSDWGRDTMIALPGLTLATGRPEVAATILRTFACYVSQGMLPNRFPDAGETPEYNTVDATLWYFQAVYQHWRYTKTLTLGKELYPCLADIIRWHQRGARYNIKVDPEDGLLFAGEPGVQLTWMDARVGDRVVTPRLGKAVEVNALWYNALRIMAELSKRLRQPEAAREYAEQANMVAENFRRRFWFEPGGYLYDVIDGPDGELGPDGRRYDASLRPNQIFAVSLPFPLLTDTQAKVVVDTCARHLWTSPGLRTLADHEVAYVGHYGGDQDKRDGAYHQGTVWGWLLGSFATAHYRVYGDGMLARSLLTPVKAHLTDAGFGSISEIFDGDPPHAPRGCFAQAWSVAEILRAWQEIGA